jgi:hypothetical protein
MCCRYNIQKSRILTVGRIGIDIIQRPTSGTGDKYGICSLLGSHIINKETDSVLVVFSASFCLSMYCSYVGMPAKLLVLMFKDTTWR